MTQIALMKMMTKDVCRYFMNGNCRHGFHGKTPKGDRSKCRFFHPKVCDKWMNHGKKDGGCNGKCDKTHPRMCHNSLENGRCENVGKGKRCNLGYHVRRTRTVSINDGTSNGSQPKQSQVREF